MEHRAGRMGARCKRGTVFQRDASDACEEFASRRGVGYMTQGERYLMGAFTTAVNLFVFPVLRTPWPLFATR